MVGIIQGVRGGWLRVVAGWQGGTTGIRSTGFPALGNGRQTSSSSNIAGSSSAVYELLPQMADTLYEKQIEAQVVSQAGSDSDRPEVDWTEEEEKALVRK